MPSATSDTTGTTRVRFHFAAALLATVFGVATGFAADEHHLTWLFGAGNMILVYVVTVVVYVLKRDRLGKQIRVPQDTSKPDTPAVLWSRARKAAKDISLPEANTLVTVLDEHLDTINDVNQADGDHDILVKELRDEMEAAVILLEQGADKLAEKLQSMSDNLKRLQEEARDTL